MIEKITSDLTGKEYYPTRCVRIINPLQAAFFWKNHVVPVDIYPSVDFNNDNKPILVYIFEKETTRELYDEWKSRKSQEVSE